MGAMKKTKAMKKVKVMKAMKKKAMKKSVIAKGKMAKAMVMRGSKEKTSGGLKMTASGRTRAAKLFRKRRLRAPRRSTLVAPFRSGSRHARLRARSWGRKAFSPWAERLPRTVSCTPRRRRSTRLEEIIGKRTLLTFGLVMRDRGFSASRVRRRHWLAA